MKSRAEGEKSLDSAINGFAFDLEEAAQELESLEIRAKKVFDNRVCVCGHPVGRHNVDPSAGRFYAGKTHICKPNASYCPCDSPVPVLKAEDLRYFLRSTKGIGHLHALGQGVIAATKAGSSVEWLHAPQCQRCDTETTVLPICFSREKVRKDEPAPITLLLCLECISTLS